MKLNTIIQGLNVDKIIGDTDIDITGVSIDSRKVTFGHLFVAMVGTKSDGHDYIDKAIANGAKVILCEHIPNHSKEGITYVLVHNTEEIVGIVATRYYKSPSKKIKLIGVTGTNGKTTIATLLYQLFRKMGHSTGLLSTVCNYINEKAIPSTHTTPDAISLNKLLGEMSEANCEYVFMEVSSHAAEQHRIGGLDFAGGIFTNLTRDHLDYHKTVDNYLKAKKSFFDGLNEEAFAITNADDKNGMVMIQNTKARKYTYSIRNMVDFKGRVLEDHFDGMLMNICGYETVVQFTGRFNASNLLAVYGTAILLGEKPEEVLRVLSTLKPISGRFETIHSPKGYTAIVDYAHTPDALNNVLSTINEVLNGKGNVITVIGAGGNRDKGKRPLMAQESFKGSNRVILTSDNPRDEDPNEIIKDMLVGLSTEEKREVLSITDRREAIRTACILAQKGDVILVAGKGHEDYQEINGIKHHFNDKEILKEFMNL